MCTRLNSTRWALVKLWCPALILGVVERETLDASGRTGDGAAYTSAYTEHLAMTSDVPGSRYKHCASAPCRNLLMTAVLRM
jgi:hypothetical protein